MLTKIILGVIVFHLVLGFGWLAYKLSPRDGDELIDSSIQEEDEKKRMI
ncbi:MAG: hypothetical protein P1U56_14760 [Saprospiraceae bacterium]|nr:hypothetical protein [Saprospiraceae bacterium]